MLDLEFEFSAVLWEYAGKGSWHFAAVPKDTSDDIRAFTKHLAKGFRSVRVTAKIGETVWKTSLFPDSESGCYFLPIKASVRKDEGLSKGDNVAVHLTIAT